MLSIFFERLKTPEDEALDLLYEDRDPSDLGDDFFFTEAYVRRQDHGDRANNNN